MAARKWHFWTGPETQCLLGILGRNRDIDIIMGSSPHPTKAIYAKIARRLERQGFSRTQVQVSAKVKVLRNAFYKAMRAYNGDPPRRAQPHYFREMYQLWEKAGRPHRETWAAAARQGRRQRAVELEDDPRAGAHLPPNAQPRAVFAGAERLAPLPVAVEPRLAIEHNRQVVAIQEQLSQVLEHLRQVTDQLGTVEKRLAQLEATVDCHTIWIDRFVASRSPPH
ncbi:uncharacterized protein LOC121934895 [Sceloporus undulatus]|uniref:uncharacterized protein LOC121934895 n=1 Tax=Sceloporus undulatus TaxID=8520 RepID=UPI001C4D4C03|nr:uncharacterized protein LOC121934895 [Sceloporus undulatus]